MLTLILLSLSFEFALSQNILAFECPVPGNPSQPVNQTTCDMYSACEFTGGVCHMKTNDKAGYLVSSNPVDTGRGFYVTLDKAVPSNTMFGGDIPQLRFEVIIHESYHLQIKITDAAQPRYEVPVPLNLPPTPAEDPLATVSIFEPGRPFTFNVTRNSTGVNVFRSDGPLTYEDQFIQMTTQLLSPYFYGMGENIHSTFKHQFATRTTNPIFTRDQMLLQANINRYGSHPYYMNIEDDDGNTNGVLLYNSNAMEYSTFTLTDGKPALTYRITGGIIDLHIFLGPTVENVNFQYSNTIGLPVFPPYHMFGFQLSRWGYESTDDYRIVRQRMKDSGIPMDVQYFDIDYMDNGRDFTLNPDGWLDLSDLVQELHDDDVKVILIADPPIVIDWDNYPPAQRGKSADVFMKWGDPSLVPNDQPPSALDYIVGYGFSNNKTVFPDFLKPETQAWWQDELIRFYQQVNFDGLSLDMNEPTNFGTNLDKPWNYPEELEPWSLKCPNNSFEDPPYPTLATSSPLNDCGRISDRTLCMSANHTDGTNSYLHYDVHSLYGYAMSKATWQAMEVMYPSQRHVIVSRSTSPVSGMYAMHAMGDNQADWVHMAHSIVAILEYNMWAIPFSGADICGFNGEPSDELCTRWMQLGAFYPSSRNHNTNGTAPQDPANPAWTTTPTAARDALLLRYKYIPYIYALFHWAHMSGYSVVRPLFNQFTTDLTARDVEDQFFWGSGLMVAPVITEGATDRDVYFPQGLWYDIVDGNLVATGPITQNVAAPIDKIPVFVLGGNILPYQEPAQTTAESRRNPFGFTLALDENRMAEGEVFWDEGNIEHVMSETFMTMLMFANETLIGTVMHNPTPADGLILGSIYIYGFGSNPSGVELNGVPLVSSEWTYDGAMNVLAVTVNVLLNENLSVVFS